MRRWHQELPIAFGQWWIHFHFVHDGRSTGCECDEQVGRFRKRRALGCGRPRCQLCHFDKIHGIRSHRQRVEDFRFQEQLQDDE